jgi:hypothetical protein
MAPDDTIPLAVGFLIGDVKDDLDLAIRPFDPPGRFAAVPEDMSYERAGEPPKAGTSVYFAGLLSSPSARSMGVEVFRS